MSSQKPKTLNLKANRLLVSGSIVIDTLFSVSSNISDGINIKDGKIGRQNLMFTGEEKKEFYGGSGGNIAYGLGMLNASPLLTSVVGKDFAFSYKKHLEENKVNLRVHEDKNSYTATFYAVTDPNGEQIGIFQPNAYFKHLERTPLRKLLGDELGNIDIAIFSPGTGKSILSQIKELKKNSPGAFVILDPGQTLLATFNKEILKECFKYSDLLIANDVEVSQIKNHFGFTLEEIFKLGVKYVIETKGENGSVLHEENKRTEVKAIKVKKSIDPTGAGDAYRAGLINGIKNRLSIPVAMKQGAKMGAECVKFVGGQTYKVLSSKF